MSKKIIFLLVSILLQSAIFADNNILSLVCVKNINTRPGETTNLVSFESLNNVLNDLNKNDMIQTSVDSKKIKSNLDEYLDPKIFRIEYGTSLKNRTELIKNYNQFIENLDGIIIKTQDVKEKEKFENIRNLRIFSYQTLTRGKNPLTSFKNNFPFGIEEFTEAVTQILNAKPFLYGKTLELLQFAGGYGDFYKELPVACAGFRFIEFLDLCFLLNNSIKKKICTPDQSMLNAFKKSCSLINATEASKWQKQKFIYSLDVPGQGVNAESELKTLGGIPQKEFISIRDQLDDFKGELTDDLKITSKIIYLNAAWSVSVMPIIEPILKDGGLMIGVISAPSDTDSATDITDSYYSKKSIQSKDVIKSFFNCFKESSMEVTNTNNGFFPYVILKKREGRLFLHYFLDPKLDDFVVGLDKREEAKRENIVPKLNFKGLLEFNETHNKEGNSLIERIYIWYCCWHAPITDDVVKQATDEALKLKSLLSFFQQSNIYLKLHTSFAEFKNSALNLFDLDLKKGKTK